MAVTKPYEFIGFGAMDVTKPYEFIGFGAMDITKPYEIIGFDFRFSLIRPDIADVLVVERGPIGVQAHLTRWEVTPPHLVGWILGPIGDFRFGPKPGHQRLGSLVTGTRTLCRGCLCPAQPFVA